jgi:hypothetical protein
MHHDASLDALSTTFINTTCKGQACVGSKHCYTGNSWWHVKQGSMDILKAKASSGRTNNTSKGVDERVLSSATSAARWHESHKGEIITLEESRARGSTRPPRPVGPGRPASPINCTLGARLRQTSSSSLSLFVCSKFQVQNHIILSHPSQV